MAPMRVPMLEVEATRDPRQFGFTLLELMIVVVIIGIMAAMIIPEMRGSFEDALLRSASRELVSVFTIASSRAVSLNETHRVRLDRKGRYHIERKAEENELVPGGFVLAMELEGAEGAIDPRVSIELRTPDEDVPAEPETEVAAAGDEAALAGGLDQVITFYPDGSADGIEILLQDRQGFRRVLRINATTSRVSIIEPDRKLAAVSPEEPGAAR